MRLETKGFGGTQDRKVNYISLIGLKRKILKHFMSWVSKSKLIHATVSRIAPKVNQGTNLAHPQFLVAAEWM
jgi:hypothetical protein